jgi:hypothetical protein
LSGLRFAVVHLAASHPDRLYVKAGAFDDPTLIQPSYQSWTRSSVSWATIKAGLSCETGRSCGSADA